MRGGFAGSRLVRISALVCLAMCILVMGRRFAESWRAASTAPGVAITSGSEEESFFILWEGVHGQAVYADGKQPPYATPFFNWLFYWSYAVPVGWAARLGGDAAIPEAARMTTLACALLAAAIMGTLFRKLLRDNMPASGLVSAALAAFFMTGPLVGWWLATARPDVAALALEAAGVAAFLLIHRRRPLLATLASAAAFYLAWAFKQTYVEGLVAVALFLALRRCWRDLAVLCLLSGGLWLITFAEMGPVYRELFQTMGMNNAFLIPIGMSNAGSAAAKVFPWLLLLPASVAPWRREIRAGNGTLEADALLLGAVGFVTSTPASFILSCKIGASLNYFFGPLLFLAIAGVAGLALQRRSARGVLPVAAALLAAACMQGLVLFGVVGQISLAPQARQLAERWDVWRKLPSPRFSSDNRLNLPWLNLGAAPMFPTYKYSMIRESGTPLAHDGIGGLINEGYFAALAIPAASRDSL